MALLDTKALLTKVLEFIQNIKSNDLVVAQTVTSSSSTLAANTYVDKTANFTKPSECGSLAYHPIIAGWNVSGEGSSWIHVLGVYISGSAPNYTLHVKCRNIGANPVTGFAVTAYIRYIKNNINITW